MSMASIRPIHAIVLTLAICGQGGANGAEPLLRIRGQIVDQETGQPIAARIYIQSESGEWYFPKSDAVDGTAIEYKRKINPTSLEMHTTVSGHPFVVEVPAGKLRIRVERGKEYVPFEESFECTTGRDIKIELLRWISMAKLGWFSGDTHSHRALAEVPNLVLAEDLNIAFPLSYWVTSADTDPIRGNRVPAAQVTATPIEVDPLHLVYAMNTEYELFTVGGKPHTLGAFVVIGHKKPLDDRVPPVRSIAEKVHREGALIDLEKHSWPWSVMIVPTMQADLFELANNHVWATEFGFPKWTIDTAAKYMHLEMSEQGFTEWGWIDFGFQTYYALLNCGFRLQPTAGTASGVHPVPLGFGRVYVQQPQGFSYEKWLAGLKAGNSFVTNGPLVDVRINGQLPGHVFPAADGKWTARIQGTVYSLSPLERAELVVGGEIQPVRVLESKARLPAGFETKIEHEVHGERTNWLALRVFESKPAGRIRFAHTSPTHFEVPDRLILPSRDQIEYLIGRVEFEWNRNQGVLSAEALGEYRAALRFYQEVAERVK